MNFKMCAIKNGHQAHIWGNGDILFSCPGRRSRTVAVPIDKRRKENKKKK